MTFIYLEQIVRTRESSAVLLMDGHLPVLPSFQSKELPLSLWSTFSGVWTHICPVIFRCSFCSVHHLPSRYSLRVEIRSRCCPCAVLQPWPWSGTGEPSTLAQAQCPALSQQSTAHKPCLHRGLENLPSFSQGAFTFESWEAAEKSLCRLCYHSQVFLPGFWYSIYTFKVLSHYVHSRTICVESLWFCMTA